MGFVKSDIGYWTIVIVFINSARNRHTGSNNKDILFLVPLVVFVGNIILRKCFIS